MARFFERFGMRVSLGAAALVVATGSVAAQPNILPGHYIGSWTNTTFSVTGSIRGDVFVRGGILKLVLDVDGSVFGNPNPAPFVRSAPLTVSGATLVENGNPTFGDFTVNINAAGQITISATNVPASGVSGYNSSGTINGGAITGTGVVQLEPSGTANGIASANRSIYSSLISDNQIQKGWFGYAVAGMPDIDGDGRGDLIVGAPGETPDNISEAGRAYIITGKMGNIIRVLQSPGREVGGHFGVAVSSVPDVNADGKADVVVGASDEDPSTNPADTGRAYVYSGATGALLWKLIPPAATLNEHFGAAVAGIPDVNGDGRGDIAVGSPDETYTGSPVNAGRVHVYSGATGLRLYTIAAPTPTLRNFFGSAVAGLVDVSGDGRGDIVVGSPETDLGLTTGRPGHAYIYSGANGALLRILNSPANQADGGFGWSVAAVPDANGDGKQDVVVGAPFENPGTSPVDCGRANLYSGATGALLFKFLPPTATANGRFGWSVSGVADITGDARGDVVVGEPGLGGGRAHMYNGATGLRLDTRASVYPEAGGQFGFSVGGTVDLSGNGRGDVIVGAWKENPATAPTPPSDAGRAYILRK
jgi:hypothetical protein